MIREDRWMDAILALDHHTPPNGKTTLSSEALKACLSKLADTDTPNESLVEGMRLITAAFAFKSNAAKLPSLPVPTTLEALAARALNGPVSLFRPYLRLLMRLLPYHTTLAPTVPLILKWMTTITPAADISRLRATGKPPTPPTHPAPLLSSMPHSQAIQDALLLAAVKRGDSGLLWLALDTLRTPVKDKRIPRALNQTLTLYIDSPSAALGRDILSFITTANPPPATPAITIPITGSTPTLPRMDSAIDFNADSLTLRVDGSTAVMPYSTLTRLEISVRRGSITIAGVCPRGAPCADLFATGVTLSAHSNGIKKSMTREINSRVKSSRITKPEDVGKRKSESARAHPHRPTPEPALDSDEEAPTDCDTTQPPTDEAEVGEVRVDRVGRTRGSTLSQELGFTGDEGRQVRSAPRAKRARVTQPSAEVAKSTPRRAGKERAATHPTPAPTRRKSTRPVKSLPAPAPTDTHPDNDLDLDQSLSAGETTSPESPSPIRETGRVEVKPKPRTRKKANEESGRKSVTQADPGLDMPEGLSSILLGSQQFTLDDVESTFTAFKNAIRESANAEKDRKTSEIEAELAAKLDRLRSRHHDDLSHRAHLVQGRVKRAQEKLDRAVQDLKRCVSVYRSTVDAQIGLVTVARDAVTRIVDEGKVDLEKLAKGQRGERAAAVQEGQEAVEAVRARPAAVGGNMVTMMRQMEQVVGRRE